jgi:hypothetical protein
MDSFKVSASSGSSGEQASLFARTGVPVAIILSQSGLGAGPMAQLPFQVTTPEGERELVPLTLAPSLDEDITKAIGLLSGHAARGADPTQMLMRVTRGLGLEPVPSLGYAEVGPNPETVGAMTVEPLKVALRALNRARGIVERTEGNLVRFVVFVDPSDRETGVAATNLWEEFLDEHEDVQVEVDLETYSESKYTHYLKSFKPLA